MPCEGACHENECRDVSDCPVWDDYYDSVACSRDCGGGSRTRTSCNVSCSGFVTVFLATGESSVVRTTWADAPCTACAGTVGYIAVSLSGGGTVRVTAPAPWRVAGTTSCTAAAPCGVFNGSGVLYLLSSSLDGGPVNVVFESVANGTTCPP